MLDWKVCVFKLKKLYEIIKKVNYWTEKELNHYTVDRIKKIQIKVNKCNIFWSINWVLINLFYLNINLDIWRKFWFNY